MTSLGKFSGLAFVATTILIGHTSTTSCSAEDYTPTQLTKTIEDHEWIVVARVVERAGGRAAVSVLKTVKGKGLPKSLSLPDTWRAGTERTFGPIRLTKDSTYLFFLKKAGRREYRLSDDFASKGVTPVENVDAPMVRAVMPLTSLVGNRSRAQRLQTFQQIE